MAKRNWTLIVGTSVFLTLVTVGFVSPPSAHAQDPAGAVALTRASIQKDRREIVNQYLGLTAAEGTQFWPLYQEYQERTARENDKTVKMIGDLLSREEIKDEEMIRALDEYSKTAKNKISIRQDYVKKFAKFLPARKVVRWYQLENKMDAIIANDLAGTVPLMPGGQ